MYVIYHISYKNITKNILEVINMKTKNRTTLFIDSEIIDTIKQIAINKNTTQTKIINDYLKQGIEKRTTKKQI